MAKRKHHKQLSKYMECMTTEERANFAARCGVSLGSLRNILYGLRKPNLALAAALERESGGVLKRTHFIDRRVALAVWPDIDAKASA